MVKMTVNPSKLVLSNKRMFDPTNKEDLAEYRHFIKHGRWKSTVCPFQAQWPYIGIPQMIADRISEYYVTKVVTK